MRNRIGKFAIIVLGTFAAGIVCLSESIAWNTTSLSGSDASGSSMPVSGGGSYSTPAESSSPNIFTITSVSYNGSYVDGVNFGSSNYAQVTLSDNWVDPVTSDLVPAGSVFYINTGDISASEIKSAGIMGDAYAAQVSLSNGDKVWGYMKEYSQGVAGTGNHEQTLLTGQELKSQAEEQGLPELLLSETAFRDDNNLDILSRSGRSFDALTDKISGGYAQLTGAQKAEWRDIYQSSGEDGFLPWGSKEVTAEGEIYSGMSADYVENTALCISTALEVSQDTNDPSALKAVEFIAKTFSVDGARGKAYSFVSGNVDSTRFGVQTHTFNLYSVNLEERTLTVNGTNHTFMLPKNIR